MKQYKVSWDILSKEECKIPNKVGKAYKDFALAKKPLVHVPGRHTETLLAKNLVGIRVTIGDFIIWGEQLQ